VVLFGCNETKDVGLSALVSEYYPVRPNETRIYNVEEIIYEISGFDTLRYQLRESVIDSIIASGEPSYLLQREIRTAENQPWVVDSVWSYSVNDRILTIRENNIPLVKLSAPVSEGTTWDGNAFNTRSEQTYYYQQLVNPLIDSVNLNDHIRVIIEDIPKNVVDQDERSEVYVRGIGLVEKDYLSLTFCTTSDVCSIGEIITGRSLKQQLIELTK
jgi:hypothetical protein